MKDNLVEQSRAEQSRAEQSRAEQSRAEQSRAEQSLIQTLVFVQQIVREHNVNYNCDYCRDCGWRFFVIATRKVDTVIAQVDI